MPAEPVTDARRLSFAEPGVPLNVSYESRLLAHADGVAARLPDATWTMGEAP
jgi:hypothetical protein